jgi:hypothetical protein
MNQRFIGGRILCRIVACEIYLLGFIAVAGGSWINPYYFKQFAPFGVQSKLTTKRAGIYRPFFLGDCFCIASEHKWH